jgi:putative ABC transport system ATP-binding protein
MMSKHSPAALVNAQQLGKAYTMGYGTVQALHAIDLTITAGELIGIMGPSGSGKSTLMHLLGCLDRPSHGSYHLDGVDISELDDSALAEIRATKIGFVFQSFNLIPQLNVYENVEVPFLYQRNRIAHVKERIVESIERVGLKKRIHHLPTELSGGEMQRVAIARALAIDPSLILADEPTGNLDSETGASILSLFQELNNQGVTLILVTHDPHVGAHCRRLIRMRDGRMVSDERQPGNGIQ